MCWNAFLLSVAGNGVDDTTLLGIGGTADFVFSVDDFDLLNGKPCLTTEKPLKQPGSFHEKNANKVVSEVRNVGANQERTAFVLNALSGGAFYPPGRTKLTSTSLSRTLCSGCKCVHVSVLS